MDDFLLEGISAGLGTADHLDHLGVLLSASGLQRCYGFLCHGSDCLMSLLDLFVNGVLAQHRVVFLHLNPLRGILPVLRGDVPGSTRNARGFVLCAFENHLYAVAFLRHLT